MAVDTRNRRFSMLAFGQAHGSPYVFPNPDGTINSDDRAQFAYLYAGISIVTGQPTMARWGGVPFVTIQRPFAGRTW